MYTELKNGSLAFKVWESKIYSNKYEHEQVKSRPGIGIGFASAVRYIRTYM